MAMVDVTYEQFQKELEASGMANQFSQADLALAQKNPNAGLSILQYKKDYMNAKTDAERAAANKGAEQVRSSWGEYTGGKDGGGYYLNPMSPGGFQPGEKPSYSNQYQDKINDLLNQQLGYGEYSYGGTRPEYQNRYDEQIQELLGQLVNRPDFSYDPETDPLYSQYRKQYSREGTRAVEDTLARAAAMSGGLPSSYATTAGAQAGNYYAAQMTDKIPELYELAYQKYLNDYQMDLSNLGAVQGAEQSDYNKYLGELSQYNTDRNFDYNAWVDRYNMINNNLNTAAGLEQMDYQKYLNELSQYNTDRDFQYGQFIDEVNSQTQDRQEALQNAILAAEYGDYSKLKEMGIDMSNTPTEWERQYNLALLAAQYGDYTLLKKLGITPNLQNMNQYALAGSGSLGNGTAGGWVGTSSGRGGSNRGSSTGSQGSNRDSGSDATYDSFASLRRKYPGGTVTNREDWEDYVALYGEDALRAAGFFYGSIYTKEDRDRLQKNGQKNQ